MAFCIFRYPSIASRKDTDQTFFPLEPRKDCRPNSNAVDYVAMVVFSCLKRHWRRAWCWPVEVRVAAFFGAVLAMGLALGLPANLPDRPSLDFVHRHFLRPLFLA